jgi:hypothetical protein
VKPVDTRCLEVVSSTDLAAQLEIPDRMVRYFHAEATIGLNPNWASPPNFLVAFLAAREAGDDAT